MIDFSTFGGLLLSNNIFWGNALAAGVFDIDLGGQFVGATLANNDIEASTGTPVAEAGTLSVDPGFAAIADFRLARSSPLIDAGTNDAAGGLAGIDLDGSPRIEHGGLQVSNGQGARKRTPLVAPCRAFFHRAARISA